MFSKHRVYRFPFESHLVVGEAQICVEGYQKRSQTLARQKKYTKGGLFIGLEGILTGPYGNGRGLPKKLLKKGFKK